MKLHYIATAAASLVTLAVHAQSSAPAPSTAPRADAAISARAQAACRVAARRTLHDHGVERGYGPMPIKKCNTVVASSATQGGTPPRNVGKADNER